MKAEPIITGSAAHLESLEATANRLALAHGLFSSEAIRARIVLHRVAQGLPEHAEPRIVRPLDASDTIKAARSRLRALQRKAEAAFRRHGWFSGEACALRLSSYYLEDRIAATLSAECTA